MRTELTREDARASLRRWELVRTRQREEMRRMTLEEKFRRLSLLVQARLHLTDPHREMEEEVIRNRWRRLREIKLA